LPSNTAPEETAPPFSLCPEPLKEYVKDYASPEVKTKAEAMIKRLLSTVPNEKARATAAKYLDAIDNGERDFRF
jgi:2-iminoacetate synthase